VTKTISVRELKNRTSRIVAEVRNGAAEYVVTLHGEPVAVLRRFTAEEARRQNQSETEAALEAMYELSREVADAWSSSKSAVELIEEQRQG
jgi:antitoxin (DNA-binding transcriptional repressor) of toxin-antitoxin stability system